WSRSTSYQLFNIKAPAINNVPPIVINKNLSQNSKKLASVKYRANQKPLKIGSTLATRTIPFTNDVTSTKKPFKLCLSISFSILYPEYIVKTNTPLLKHLVN